jgi:hypothetical protein
MSASVEKFTQLGTATLRGVLLIDAAVSAPSFAEKATGKVAF